MLFGALLHCDPSVLNLLSIMLQLLVIAAAINDRRAELQVRDHVIADERCAPLRCLVVTYNMWLQQRAR